MDNSDPAQGAASVSDSWWLPIGVLVVILPIGVVVSLAFPPDAFTSLLVAPISLTGLLITVLSPVFVYFDRRYLEATGSWRPSGWYYLMILPPLNLVLPAFYCYQRHKYVGVP